VKASGDTSVAAILRDVASYLEHQLEEGHDRIEMPLPEAAPPEHEDLVLRGLTAIAGDAAVCRKCPLHASRTRPVPGQGAAHPDILFVGEAPGADEDRQGLAFVGAAGQLLTKMIEAMGYTRDRVFIANVLKCRPPDNRVPMPDEMEACLPYLKAQVALLKPAVIVTLGATAVRGLLGLAQGITKLRGSWLSFEGVPVMPTYHPAFLLRNPDAKHQAWEDLKAVLKRLGKTPPPGKTGGQRRES
jgi:uracil-DNA glycosylase